MSERGTFGNREDRERGPDQQGEPGNDPNELDRSPLEVPSAWTKDLAGDPEIDSAVTRHAFRIVAEDLGLGSDFNTKTNPEQPLDS